MSMRSIISFSCAALAGCTLSSTLRAQIAKYDTINAAALRRAAKEDRLVYYAVGREDFLYRSVAPARALLDKYGIKHVYHESGGGHTWTNWREYLNDFAPRLFR